MAEFASIVHLLHHNFHIFPYPYHTTLFPFVQLLFFKQALTQDIFLEVYKGINGFRGLCSERTWVFKIAKNRLFDFYRKQYSQPSDTIPIDGNLIEQISDYNQDLEEYLQTTYESQRVRECLRQLPQQYKIVLLLKYIEEKRVKETAQILDKSPKSVESMLQRARGAFINLYGKEEK